MDFVERLFWSVAIFLGVHFIWLTWIETMLPIGVGTAVAVVLTVGFFTYAMKAWPYEDEE